MVRGRVTDLLARMQTLGVVAIAKKFFQEICLTLPHLSNSSTSLLTCGGGGSCRLAVVQ